MSHIASLGFIFLLGLGLFSKKNLNRFGWKSLQGLAELTSFFNEWINGVFQIKSFVWVNYFINCNLYAIVREKDRDAFVLTIL